MNKTNKRKQLLSNMVAKPLDLTHPEANMYGCFPCPFCKSRYRWPNQERQVVCDDCGLIQPQDQ